MLDALANTSIQVTLNAPEDITREAVASVYASSHAKAVLPWLILTLCALACLKALYDLRLKGRHQPLS